MKKFLTSLVVNAEGMIMKKIFSTVCLSGISFDDWRVRLGEDLVINGVCTLVSSNVELRFKYFNI
mgnify:CR=1 FL=1